MGKAKCEVARNRLVVSGDFSTDGDRAFDAACEQLLAAGDKELVADLGAVGSLSSTYVGLLAETCLKAEETGRKVVIRASPRLASLLKEAGLNKVARIEEAGR